MPPLTRQLRCLLNASDISEYMLPGIARRSTPLRSGYLQHRSFTASPWKAVGLESQQRQSEHSSGSKAARREERDNSQKKFARSRKSPTRNAQTENGQTTRAGQERTVQPKEKWMIYKDALKQKFGDVQWNPKKKVSPDAMEGIRAMHAQYPQHFTTQTLAVQFGLSPDAVRRILKGKWKPTAQEEDERRERWDRRGERIWKDLVDEGVRPPKRWRMMGIGSGPRRPAQDRELQKAIREGRAKDPAEAQNEWLQSLSQRMS